MEKTLVKQFLDVVPALVRMCIDYVEEEDSQYKTQLATAIKSGWEELPDYDFHSMYDEVCECLEKLLKDGTEKRYAYSLITPFREYSEAFYGDEIIRLSKESIAQLKGVEGSDKMIRTYEEQIEDAESRAEKFFEIIHTAEYDRDDTEIIFFELVNGYIHWYGNMLDAAFAVNGINIDTIQEECGVCVKYIWNRGNPKFRMIEIAGYVGSFRLAESYLEKLVNDKQQEEKSSIYGDNTSLQDESPASWILANKEQYQRFELKNVSYRQLYDLCVDESLGIMSKEIQFDYFTDIVQRAQFGKIYNHCDTSKGKFRLLVTRLSKHTSNNDKKKEYRQEASISMELKDNGVLDVEKLGRFNVSKKDKFRTQLEKIL